MTVLTLVVEERESLLEVRLILTLWPPPPLEVGGVVEEPGEVLSPVVEVFNGKTLGLSWPNS